jgi:hypothetical protein
VNKRTKQATVAFAIFLLAISAIWIAYSLTLWVGTISWTVEEKAFSVWDSASDGATINSPYTLDLGTISMGQQTFDFYIQNDGDIEITVNVQSEVESGCTSSWSSTGSYVVPIGTSRALATLTLDITATGSYDWEFVIL